MLKLSTTEFESLVAEALEDLPDPFTEMIDNVFVMVEELPTAEDLEEVGLEPHQADELFGLYHGVPVGDRGVEYSSLPDRVVLYRRPILKACRSRAEARREIRDTVVHELGHFFGLSDEEMPY